MRIIKILAKQIADEISGMEEYAICALDLKYTDPDLSKVYYEMAKTEYSHAQKLHECVLKKIAEAEKLDIKPSEKMLAKWDEKHKKLLEQTASAKAYLDMYK